MDQFTIQELKDLLSGSTVIKGNKEYSLLYDTLQCYEVGKGWYNV